jgi:hypothetical protein
VLGILLLIVLIGFPLAIITGQPMVWLAVIVIGWLAVAVAEEWKRSRYRH